MANYLGKIRTNSQYHNFKKSLEQSLKSIPGSIGGKIMDKLRKSKDSIKRLVISGMLFEDMGITYIGPIDGHDMNQLLMAFQSAARVNEAVLVHVVTKKGKGYKPAEENPSKYHGVDAFNIKTGNGVSNKKGKSYTEVFSDTMLELGKKDDKIVAITAAMPSGTGLTNFYKQFPDRFFDVGIAEEHAVTFAAGLAVGGMKPVVAIYSTFLQRAYDQIIHDVCINSLPVIFAIDRGGLVGSDGETHQGIFDITYLSHLPSMTLMAPKNGIELHDMLLYASQYDKGPVAIRYPRGKVYEGLEEYHKPLEYGKSEIIYEAPQGIVLLAVGSMVDTAVRVRELLIADGKEVTLVNVRFISPMDEELLHRLATTHAIWITLEENIRSGGFGEKVSSFLVDNEYQNITQRIISLPNQFIEHGDVAILKEKNGLDEVSVFKKILEICN
jgi:1-deoxy-D-xylulose-5-phosphate synthase